MAFLFLDTLASIPPTNSSHPYINQIMNVSPNSKTSAANLTNILANLNASSACQGSNGSNQNANVENNANLTSSASIPKISSFTLPPLTSPLYSSSADSLWPPTPDLLPYDMIYDQYFPVPMVLDSKINTSQSSEMQLPYTPAMSPASSPAVPSFALNSAHDISSLSDDTLSAIDQDIAALSPHYYAEDTFDHILDQAELGGIISSQNDQFTMIPSAELENLLSGYKLKSPGASNIAVSQMDDSFCFDPSYTQNFDTSYGFDSIAVGDGLGSCPLPIASSEFKADRGQFSPVSSSFSLDGSDGNEKDPGRSRHLWRTRAESPYSPVGSSDDSDDSFSETELYPQRRSRQDSNYIPYSDEPGYNQVRSRSRPNISKTTITDPTADLSQKWVCKEKNCKKAYNGRSGLRYHREHAHGLCGPLPANLIPPAFRNGSNLNSNVKKGSRESAITKKRVCRPALIEGLQPDEPKAPMSKLDEDEPYNPLPPSSQVPASSTEEVKKWICGVPGCGKVYSGRSGLRYHRATQHKLFGTVPNYLCVSVSKQIH